MNRLAMMVLKNLYVLPGIYSKLSYNAKHTDTVPEIEKYRHIQSMLKRAVKAGNVDLQVFGRENIPAENGFLLVGNHQGLFDVVSVVVTCDNPIGAVYKKELEGKPLIDPIAKCTHSFAMDREDARQSLTVIQAVTEEMKKGRNYLIFPEGTRSKNGNQMGDFHGGSFRCAVKAKAPILPFAVIDTHKVLDGKGSGPISAQLHYLPPIPYEEYKDLKTVELAAMVKERIGKVIAENEGK